MANEGVSLSYLATVGTVYLILLAFVTWPAILHPGLLASPPVGDRGANVWNLWWAGECLKSGTDPRWTPLLFHPDGCPLVHHSLSLTNGILLAPVTSAAGPFAAYGVAFFLWAILTGIGGTLWSKRWLGSREGAWLAGFFLTFSAYRFAHLDHLNLFTTAGIPWCFWAIDRLVERRRLKDISICSGLWLLTAFSCWYYGIIVGLYWIVRVTLSWRKDWSVRDTLPGIIPLACVGLVVFLYLYLPLPGRSVEPDPIPLPVAVYWSMSLEDLVRPFMSAQPAPEFSAQLGLFFLLLVILGSIRKQEGKSLLLGIAVMYAILSLGPFLKISDKPTLFLLPGYLFRLIPGFAHMKVYTRFMYACLICLSPFAVRGALRIGEWMTKEFDSRSPNLIQRSILILVAALFWFEQSLPPFGPWPVRASEVWEPDPAVIETVKQTDGAVLELPFTPSSRVGLHMARQTRHGRPLIIGEVSRVQGYRAEFLERFDSLVILDDLAVGREPAQGYSSLSMAITFKQDQSYLKVGSIVLSASASKATRIKAIVASPDSPKAPIFIDVSRPDQTAQKR